MATAQTLLSSEARERQSTTRFWIVLLLFSAFYFTDVLIRQSEKYFWYDEICTAFFSRFDLHTYARGMRTGFELTPPLFHILTRMSQAVLGVGRLGTRAPEILGFWIMCLCLFRFLYQRVGLAAGIIAMLFPIFTETFYYSYEARPYALILGLCGIALVSWQNSLKSEKRLASLLIFSFSLLLIFLLHSFSLLVSGPFLAVELYLFARTWSIRWNYLAAIAVPTVIGLASHVPLVQTYRGTIGVSNFGAAAARDWGQIVRFYIPILSPCLWLLILALVVLSTALLFRVSESSSMASSILAEEVIVAVGFAFLPAIGIFVTKAMHMVFFSRYMCPSVIGICLLVAMALSSARVRWFAAPAFAILLSGAALWQLGGILLERSRHIPSLIPEPSSGFTLNVTLGGPLSGYEPILKSLDPGTPIATTYPLDFLYLAYYSPELRPRLYYVASNHKDLFYHVLENFRAISPVHFNRTLMLDEFLPMAQHVYIIGFDWGADLTAIVNSGARLRSLRSENYRFIADAELPAR